MSYVSGYRSGYRTALRSGYNPSDAGASWSTDATSNKALPATGAEAAALLAAASISATTLGLWRFGAAASGNFTDASGNGKTLTVTGTSSYQQSVTGWTATAWVPVAGSPGCIAENNTFANVSSNAFTVICWAELVAAGALRTVFRLGDTYDDDCTFNETNTPRIQGGEGDATYTTGTSDPLGAVRPYALSCGASVILASDQETLAIGTKAANGTTLTFGGNNAETNFSNNTKYVLGWIIDTALSSAQIKALFVAAGWAVPW